MDRRQRGQRRDGDRGGMDWKGKKRREKKKNRKGEDQEERLDGRGKRKAVTSYPVTPVQ